jgi:DNA-directed RNA polymerase specialized sigma24 family protein
MVVAMRSSSASFPSGNTPLIGSAARAGRSCVVSPEPRGQIAENFTHAPESAPSIRVTDKRISAFAQLVRPFERAIYLAALAFVYDPDEAVEVAQESVLHAFRSLPDATTAEQLRSWLIDIVIDRARAFLRERKQVDCDEIAIEDEPDILDLACCPLAQLVPISGNAMSPQEKREILSKTLGMATSKVSRRAFSPRCSGLYHRGDRTSTWYLGRYHPETTGMRQIWGMFFPANYATSLDCNSPPQLSI